MFNSSLKKDALEIHKNAVDRYNDSYKKMRIACDELYNVRERALGGIAAVEVLVSTIANKPKEFDKQLGEIKQHTRTNIKQSEPMLFKEELVRIVYNFLYIYRSYGVMLVPSRVMGADLLGAFSGEIGPA